MQFHPEVDRALVEQWIAEDTGDDIRGPGLRPDDVRVNTQALADDAAARLRLLVAGFLGLLDKDPQHDVHGIR